MDADEAERQAEASRQALRAERIRLAVDREAPGFGLDPEVAAPLIAPGQVQVDARGQVDPGSVRVALRRLVNRYPRLATPPYRPPGGTPPREGPRPKIQYHPARDLTFGNEVEALKKLGGYV